MESRHYWEESGQAVKYENYSSREEFARTPVGQLKFATMSAGTADGAGGVPSDDDADYLNGVYLKKGKQDPMSHRIIEKRRRDRMNNCLADLSRLIPPEYLKKGRGRVEKTEIIEMAIRYLKYLSERVNAAERTSETESFRAGWHECTAEAVRYLADTRGLGGADGLCVQLAAYLQRRGDSLIKGESTSEKRSNVTNGMLGAGGTGSSSSEATSSSSSSKSYPKNGVIAARQPESENGGLGYDHFEVDPTPPADHVTLAPPPYDGPYPMDYDKNGAQPYDVKYWIGNVEAAEPPAGAEATAAPAPARALRAVRRPDLMHVDDYMHSYKFKNSIERRFSRSQDNEARDMSVRHVHPHSKAYLHKRRRAAPKHAPLSTSTSASGSTEEARENSPQDSSDSPHRHYTPKPTPPTVNHSDLTPNHYVPVFALNALGKYYVPLSVEYACLARQLGPYNMLDSHAAHVATPLHPVTIHVNFQPCLDYHVKRESNDHDWHPT